jgi:hypothetical protein
MALGVFTMDTMYVIRSGIETLINVEDRRSDDVVKGEKPAPKPKTKPKAK